MSAEATQPGQTTPDVQAEPQAKMPRRRRILLIVVAALAVAGLGVGISAALGAFSTPTFTLHGAIDLSNTDGSISTDENGACFGTGGYSDMGAGTAVTVADGSGKTVALGMLGTGTAVDGTTACVLSISVPNVPANLDEYAVTVSHRGTQVFTADQAKKGFLLTLGGN